MTNTKPTWEDEFDALNLGFFDCEGNVVSFHQFSPIDNIKNFIVKVEKEAYERGRQVNALKMDCQKCGKDFGENKEWMLLLRHKNC